MSQVPPKADGAPEVAKAFDDYAPEYEERIEAALAFSGLEHSVFVNGKADILRALAKVHFSDPSQIAVLDVGCGTGNAHDALKGAFGSLDGIDISEQSLAHARTQHPEVNYTHYNGGRLPFPTGRFDLAFAVCVMHHVPPAGWPEFVAEMARTLRAGGLALIFEHNPLNPVTRRIVNSCEIDDDAVLLWPRQLRRLFRDAGFSRVHTRSIFSLPPKGAVLRSLDRGLGIFPFGAQYYLHAVKEPHS